jgi:proline iminopeptidase
MFRLDDPLFAPVAEPDSQGRLALDSGHEMHWEAVGNEAGLPLLVPHGGPGGYIKPYYRRLIDRSRYRAIFFEQRGCGRSTPLASLENNTTWHLVEDIERLRQHLKIERWHILAGSWGTTLALAYAERHPQRCRGLVLSGIFLARDVEQIWMWHHLRFVYPELWAELHDFLNEDERKEPGRALMRRVLDPRPQIHGPAAVMLSAYEAQTLDVRPDAEMIEAIKPDAGTIASGRVFAHYDLNDYFLEPNQLLRDAGRLKGIPGVIINGRFDMCTPSLGAFELHRSWPGSKLAIAAVAGHRWNDPPLAREIIAALHEFASPS